MGNIAEPAVITTVCPLIFIDDNEGLLTLYVLKYPGLLELQPELYAEFLIFFTVTGLVVPGITAKFVVTPEIKSVKANAKISLEIHC